MSTNKKTYSSYINKTKELEGIISARLALQSTQKRMSRSFNIHFLSLNHIKSSPFLNEFVSWSPGKQREFINELGGPFNFKKTQGYLNSLFYQKITI